MKLITLFIITLILSGCGHSTLKAPCGAVASLSNAPCAHIPINLAARAPKAQISS